jgi:hypothetical protein
VFSAALAPWRYGPLRVAATWSYVSVRRDPEGQAFGFGDPKIYARLRAVGRDTTAVRAWLDGAARISTAQAKLFPYAWGGQEIELGASMALGLPTVTQFGVTYSWTEPGTGTTVTRADLPHALHAFALGRHDFQGWVAQARFDQLWMEDGAQRSILEAGVTRREILGIDITAAGALELGPRDERAVDSWLHLRFATRLR